MKIKLSLLFIGISLLYSCSNDDTNDINLTCFSPTQNLTIAYESDSMGCNCDSENDSDICVQDKNGRNIALVCSENKWIAVEDGPCFNLSKNIDLPINLNFSGKKIGCGDFSVTQLLDKENLNISLTIETPKGNGLQKLNLNSNFQSFSFPNSDLITKIRIWDNSVINHFCTDIIVGDTPNEIDSFKAISGSIKIKISDVKEIESQALYNISLLLENIVFENSDNQKRTINDFTIENVNVGSFSG